MNNRYLKTFCMRCSSSARLKRGKFPSYNHGLSGTGKVNRAFSPEPVLYQPKGEILFGIHPVSSALQAKKREKFNRLFIKTNSADNENLERIVQLASEEKIEVSEVKSNILDSLSGARPHQGVCLDVSRFPVKRFSARYYVRGISPDDALLWLYLHNIQDPMNMGAILRTAYFLGVDQVIVPSLNSCKMTPVVSKASAGAMEVMNPLSLGSNADHLIQFLKSWKEVGGVVVGTAVNDHYSHQVHRYQINQPTVLILGNEGFGLDNGILNQCDILLSIQPHGRVTGSSVGSLNVSVAAGIILHSLLSSRKTTDHRHLQEAV